MGLTAAQVLTAVLRDLPSQESKDAYAGDWGRYTAWLKKERVAVLSVRPSQVKSYIAHLHEEGKARSTAGRALSVIREVYAALVVEELMEVNPAREVKNPKTNQKLRTPILDSPEMQKLLNFERKTWRDHRDHVCLCLIFGLGWRRSEVARLVIDDFRDGTVTGIFKGNKEVTVGVPPWVQQVLDRWREYARIEVGAILPRSVKSAEAMTGDMVYNAVKRAANAAGISMAHATPHALRRSNITIAGERGVGLKERQLAVGHSSSATTERYDHARDAAKNAPGQVFADLFDGEEK
jgi:site-specific recombinase XerD